MEVNWQNSFPKNTAIHMSFLTHMAAFSSVCQPSYLKSFFIPAGCLGWCRQYIHLLSAAAFAELSATFPKLLLQYFSFCCLPYNTPPFHFNCKYSLFCRFFPFNVEIPTQHVFFPAIISIPILELYIRLNYRYMCILFTHLACWSILNIYVRMIHERKSHIWKTIVFVN